MTSVPDGDDVLNAISRLSAESGAWISGVGVVEGVELVVPRAGGDESVRVAGRASLVSLSGPKTGPLMAVVARAGDGGGVTVFAGELVRARSLGVVLAVSASAAAPATEGGGEASPSSSRHPEETAPARPAALAAPSATASGWAALAAVKPAEDPDEESDELPKYGDRVDHGVFGLCDVMVVRGDRMKIRDVHGTGRMREVHVGAFKILRPVVRDGKRVFKLAKRG